MKLSNENRLLILCAGNKISGDKLQDINSLLSLQIKWDEFLNIAISHGIAPLVYKNLKALPAVPPAVRERLAEIYHGNVARNMYIHSELKRIIRAFDENGIEVMLLKGAALSGTVYGDIGLRIMSDIDLLVRQECLSRAKEIMSDMAYTAESRTRTEEWYKEHHFHLAPFIHKSKSIIVEIHWNVAGDPLNININEWWNRARKISLTEAPVFIPSPEDMLLHLCISLYHGNYNKAALRGLCDIVNTICFFKEETDWKLFQELSLQSGISRPVYAILLMVRKYFDSTNKALSWLDFADADNKFNALMEDIVFSQESGSSDVFMRSLAADTKWGKTKLIFNDIFPEREKMSRRYSIRADSAKVYFYYAYRPFELAVKYGRSFIKVLCFRDSG